MTDSVEFLLAHLALVLLGGGAFLDRDTREMPIFSRAAIAFLTGGIVLTISAVALTMLGVGWNVAALLVPSSLLSIALFVYRRKRSSTLPSSAPESRSGTWSGVAIGSFVVSLLALAHWIGAIVTSRATSVDFTFFWGVKAVRFAAAGKIDAALLQWQFFGHAVPEYPPLVPVSQAWGIEVAGGMPWIAAPLSSVMWIIAAAAVIYGALRRRLERSASVIATSFWVTAISVSCANSYSGGNAEAVLLAYESAALIFLLSEREGDSRFHPALMLAGVVLTKVEGVVAVAGIVAGVALRDLVTLRRLQIIRILPLGLAPLAAVLFWFAFQWMSDLPVGYRSHGSLTTLHWQHLQTILATLPSNLGAGSFGVAWLAPIALIVMARKADWRLATPGLVLVAALFAFFVFDYLHDEKAPVERIGWTLPRISQPALSAWILSVATMIWLDRSRRDFSEPG